MDSCVSQEEALTKRWCWTILWGWLASPLGGNKAFVEIHMKVFTYVNRERKYPGNLNLPNLNASYGKACQATYWVVESIRKEHYFEKNTYWNIAAHVSIPCFTDKSKFFHVFLQVLGYSCFIMQSWAQNYCLVDDFFYVFSKCWYCFRADMVWISKGLQRFWYFTYLLST